MKQRKEIESNSSHLLPSTLLAVFSIPNSTSIQRIPGMSFASDDSSPTSSLPDSSDSDLGNDYRAPLNGEAPEPSIDGTSVTGGEGGVRVSSAEDVSAEEKKVSSHFSLDRGVQGVPRCAVRLYREQQSLSAILCHSGSR